MSDERFTALETLIGDVDIRLSAELHEVRTGLSELDRNMRVLHEDTISRIAALAPLEAAARRNGGPRRG